MALVRDNDCVSCERCVNCGRGYYYYADCDKCGETEEDKFKYKGYMLCVECLFEELSKEGKIVCVDDENWKYDSVSYNDSSDIKKQLERDFDKVVIP